MRVPLGVIGIIYESRPNVTADAGGSVPQVRQRLHPARRQRGDAFEPGDRRPASQAGLKAAGLPEDAVQVVATTDRAAVGELITMKPYVDVIVPRGGKGLIERIAQRGARAGDQAPGRHLPRLHRRPRRSGQGGGDRRQRQDAALRHLQHHGDAAGGAGDRRQGAARASASIYAEKGVEMRCCPESKAILQKAGIAKLEGRDRGGLPHRISGARSSPSRRVVGHGRGDRAHRRSTARSTPTRS